jgi:hypothetical protein
MNSNDKHYKMKQNKMINEIVELKNHLRLKYLLWVLCIFLNCALNQYDSERNDYVGLKNTQSLSQYEGKVMRYFLVVNESLQK